jgi:hypothetical protein
MFSFFPDRYDYWVREDGPFENGTAVACLLGAALCVHNILLRRKLGFKNFFFIFIAFSAFLFVGGEEISWGQRLFVLKPVKMAGEWNLQREFTVHNLRGVESWMIPVGFAFTVVVGGVLPVLSYLSKPLRQFLVKTGVPVMPPAVNIAWWLGGIFLVLIHHFDYRTGGSLSFHWAVNYRIQEYREFYFSFVLFAYAAADTFSLLKFKRPYEPGLRAKDEIEAGIVRRWAADLDLIFPPAKPVILLALIFSFILLPLSREYRVRQTAFDHKMLYSDPRLRIFEGEKVQRSNFEGYWMGKGEGVFKDKFLSYYADELPDEGHALFQYVISADRDGYYKIFVGGSPPGPSGDTGHQSASAYDVLIDGTLSLLVSEESKKAQLKKAFGNDFYSDFVYGSGLSFTKIGEFYLTAGEHRLEFKISRPEPYEKKYVFWLDAIFLVPPDWEPREPFRTLPDDVFGY